MEPILFPYPLLPENNYPPPPFYKKVVLFFQCEDLNLSQLNLLDDFLLLVGLQLSSLEASDSGPRKCACCAPGPAEPGPHASNTLPPPSLLHALGEPWCTGDRW